jgi:hypothetical protein
VVSVFSEEVQHIARAWPPEREVAADLGTGVESNKQVLGADRIGWFRAQLILPKANELTGAQLEPDQASDTLPLARFGVELKVDCPDGGEGPILQSSPRSFFRTG